MAPCFGHTGVTFDAENDRSGFSSLRGHFEAARGCFWRLKAFFEAVVLLEVHDMDIQLCCFQAGIYVCVHLFGYQNKSTCFQKFKSSNIFWLPVASRPAALRRNYIGEKRLVYI